MGSLKTYLKKLSDDISINKLNQNFKLLSLKTVDCI